MLDICCAPQFGAGRIRDRIRRSGTSVPKEVVHAALREYSEVVGTKKSKRAANGCGTSACAPAPCSARTASGRTTGAGSHHVRMMCPASLYSGACSTRPPVSVTLRRWKRPYSYAASRCTYCPTAAPSSTPPNQKKAKVVSRFKKRLECMGILAGATHPQTNGKPERARGEMQRKFHLFHDAAGSRAYVPSTHHTSRRTPRRGS